MKLDLTILADVWPFLMRGLGVTVMLIGLVLVITLPFAVLIALALNSRSRLLTIPLRVLSWICRGVPPLIILFLVFFALPQFGLDIEPFPAGVLAMSIFMSFYFAEAVRAGLISVPRGQYQAAEALGLPQLRTFFRIILPQALPSMIPPYISYATEVVKSSALTAVIGVGELTGNAYQLILSTNRTLEILLAIGALYVVLDSVLLVLQSYSERRWLRRS